MSAQYSRPHSAPRGSGGGRGLARAAWCLATALLGAAWPAAGGNPCPSALVDTARAVAQLRAVPGGLSPACRVISPAALSAELDRKLRRDLPLPPEKYLQVLVRLGFATGDPQAMYGRLLDFYTGQVLGFYEPFTDEMVLVDTPAARDAQASLLWAHELAHAAQEKRFSLPSRLLAMRNNSDRQRAASAIAEGDAMLVMLLLGAPPGDEQAALAAAQRMASGAGVPIPAAPGVPEFFVADLLFPYTRGLEAVLAAYRSGGWAAVDRVLASPPESTAALRDPRRRPLPMGDEQLPVTPPGWAEVLTDTVGEWALEFWLGQTLPKEEAARVAREWDGDRLKLVENIADPGRWAFAWVIRGRTVAGRRALERALQRAVPRLLALEGKEAHRLPLVWMASGNTLELRVHWPAAPPARVQHPPVRAPAPPP